MGIGKQLTGNLRPKLETGTIVRLSWKFSKDRQVNQTGGRERWSSTFRQRFFSELARFARRPAILFASCRLRVSAVILRK